MINRKLPLIKETCLDHTTRDCQCKTTPRYEWRIFPACNICLFVSFVYFAKQQQLPHAV